MTFGWIKPVILLPAQVLTGLSQEAIEAILAHELAHIRRHDYLANLIQSTVEVVLFYHPAIWWLSRSIREIREECCDEIASEVCEDRLKVAKALTSLAEMQHPPQPALAAHSGSLLIRISRLLGFAQPEPIVSGRNAAWTLALACAVLVALGIVYSASLLAESTDSVANTKAPPSGIVLDEKGLPVPSARVLLYHAVNYWGFHNKITEEVRSDASGRFAFTKPLPFKTPHGSLRSDHYTLFALQEGKAPAWEHILGGTPEKEEFTLTLTAPVSKAYEVVDKSGNPIAGAVVWLRYAAKQENKAPAFRESLSLPHDIGLSSAMTDANGRATLHNLPNTECSVAVSKAGFEDEGALSRVTPPDGVPRFTPQRASTLEGRVTDPLGAPVVGARVWLYPKFKLHYYFLAETDKNGAYKVEKISSHGTAPDWGHYKIGIQHPRFTAEERDIAFTPGQSLANYNIAAVPGTEIIGTVTDPVTHNPVAGARVQVNSRSGPTTIDTDSKGQFRCRIVPGKMDVTLLEPPGAHYMLGSRGASTRTSAFGAEFPLTLALPGALGKLGVVSGSVVGPDGRPLAGCKVSVAIPGAFLERSGRGGNSWEGGVSTGDGRFELENMPVGLRFVLFIQSADGKLSGIQSGEMKEAPTDLGVPAILRPTNFAEVMVAGLDGKPRANLAVKVSIIVEGQSLRGKEFRTDAGGVLRVPNVMSGVQYRISEVASNYAYAHAELVPEGSASTQRKTLTVADHYRVRVESISGEALAIKSFEEFYVWILSEGKRVRWSDSPLQIHGRDGSDVMVPREGLALGKPGDKIDLLIETVDGNLVKAEGLLPTEGSLLLAKAKESTLRDALPDPTISNIQSSEITGRIVSPDGRPLSGATVTFSGAHWRKHDGSMTPEEWVNHMPVFTTDSEGIFRVPDAEKKWFTYGTVFKEGFGPVFLTDLPVGEGFKVTLQASSRLKGTIGGERPGKVALEFKKDKSTRRERMGYEVPNIQYRTTTNEKGAYDFPMEPGTYRFTATSEDGRFATGEVVVVQDRTRELPAVLRAGHTVALQLIDWETGKPVRGIRINIRKQKPNGVLTRKEGSERTSVENGIATWDNLPPGDTDFNAPLMDYGFPEQEQHSYVRWWREDEPIAGWRIDPRVQLPTRGDGVQAIRIEIAEGLPPIRIFMERGVKISGVVTGPDGAAMNEVRVGVVVSGRDGQGITADSRFTFPTNGNGEFAGYIPAGNGLVYNLCAYSWPEKESTVANAVSEPFSSKPGDSLTFQLQIAAGAWVTGRVLDAAGKPIADLKVTADPADGMEVAYANRIGTVNGEGAFRVGPLRAGTYEIKVGTGEGVPIRITPGVEPKRIEVADQVEKNVGDFIVPSQSTSTQ
jgi:hypothetical protein